MFISLGFSKGIGNIAVFSLLILSLAQFDKSTFVKSIKTFSHVTILILVFITFIIGLTYTKDLNNGLIILKNNHRFLLIPIVFLLNVSLIIKHYKTLIFSFFITTSIAGLITIFFSFLDESSVINISETIPFLKSYTTHVNRVSFGLYSPFLERIQFSNMLGLSVVSGIYLYIKNFKYKKLILLGILILIYTSILLGGRGGQLALLGVMFVFAFMLIYNYWAPKWIDKFGKPVVLSVIISGLVIMFLAGPILLFKYNNNISQRYGQMMWELKTFYNSKERNVEYIDFTSVRRLVSWKNTWEIIKENPILGVGTGDYKSEIQKIYDEDGYVFPENAHSQYLYIWAMLGIVGLSVFIGVIVYWLNYLKMCSKEFMFGIAFITFYGISMIPDAVLIKQIDSMAFCMFFCLIGIVGSLYRKNDNSQLSDSK